MQYKNNLWKKTDHADHTDHVKKKQLDAAQINTPEVCLRVRPNATVSLTKCRRVQVRISDVDTLRKKSANEPVRFGLFDVVAAALFADVREDSLPSTVFFGLDW